MLMIVGFQSFVTRMLTNYNIPIPACEINSDIIENFFVPKEGGNKTNPLMIDYLYNINSIVLGQPFISTKCNIGVKARQQLCIILLLQDL